MNIFKLSDEKPVTLTAQQLFIALSSSPSDLQCELMYADDHSRVPEFRKIDRQRWYIPRLDRNAVLHVDSQGEVLPDGSAITLMGMPEDTNVHLADTVQLENHDIAGIINPEILSITPDNDAGTLTFQIIGRNHHDPLTGIALASRNITRSQFNPGRVPEQLGDLYVIVDKSASMRSWFEDGSIDATLQLLMGIDASVGTIGLHVSLDGGNSWILAQPPLIPKEISDAFASNLGETGASFSPSHNLPGTAVVISDHVIPLVDPHLLVLVGYASAWEKPLERHVIPLVIEENSCIPEFLDSRENVESITRHFVSRLQTIGGTP